MKALADVASAHLPAYVWVAIVAGVMSLITFGVYAWDKRRAKRGGRRVPESTLHLLELFGGSVGALIAQRTLRHKNEKFKYQLVFWLIVAIQITTVVGWFIKSQNR